MQKPRRSLPNFNNPEALLKQMICGKCGDIRLGHCDTCALTAQINREHPELTPAGNWQLRSEQSKKAAYNAKRRKQLFAKLQQLEFKIDSLAAQKLVMPERNKEIDHKLEKLHNRRFKVGEALESINEERRTAVEQQKKKPLDANEIILEQFQAITTCAQKLADDEQRYGSIA